MSSGVKRGFDQVSQSTALGDEVDDDFPLEGGLSSFLQAEIHGKLAEIKGLFQALKVLGRQPNYTPTATVVKTLRDAVTKVYGDVIKDANRIPSFVLAERLFNSAQGKAYFSADISAGFIEAARKEGRYEKADQAFERAKAGGYLSVAVCKEYESSLFAAQNGKMRQEAFQKYTGAKQALTQAKEQKSETAELYASFVRAAGVYSVFQEGIYEEARELFIETQGTQYFSADICLAFMETVELLSREEKELYVDAKAAFLAAKQGKCLSPDFFALFLQVASQDQGYSGIEQLFEEAKPYLSAKVYAAFIQGIANEKYEVGKERFQAAKQGNHLSPDVYLAFIELAWRCSRSQDARDAVEDAKVKGCLTSELYVAFIQNAHTNKQYQEIVWAFAHAKSNNCLNDKVYGEFIEAAGALGHYSAGKNAFESAKQDGHLTEVVYCAFFSISRDQLHLQAARSAMAYAKEQGHDSLPVISSFLHLETVA